MGQPAQLLRSFFPQKLTDVIIGFSIVDVLDFLGTNVVNMLLTVEKDFVVRFHMIRQFLNDDNSFVCFYYYRPFYNSSISIFDSVSIVFELNLWTFFVFFGRLIYF